MARKITVEWLKKHHACEEAVQWFKREFPKGIELTTEKTSFEASSRFTKLNKLQSMYQLAFWIEWLLFESCPSRTGLSMIETKRVAVDNMIRGIRVAIQGIGDARLSAISALNLFAGRKR